MNNLSLKRITLFELDEITQLTKELNPEISLAKLKILQTQMFEFNNYFCFGLFENEVLLGVSSGWITVRLYSGKQLEIDNVIINPDLQSKGYGQFFIQEIEQWALEEDFKTVELNTYVQNNRSHKLLLSRV